MNTQTAMHFALVILLFGGILVARDQPDRVLAFRDLAVVSLSRETSAMRMAFASFDRASEADRPVALPETDGRTKWAIDLARRLGNNDPSPDLIAWIVAWQRAENTNAAYNPLATTYRTPGSTCYNPVCVRNYSDRNEGLDATVATLEFSYPGYADIREGIRTNDPDRAMRGLAASPWGTNAGVVAAIYAERTETTPFLDCRENTQIIRRLLTARLAPGESWSFNEAVGDPRLLNGITACNGVYGGGWCNIAGRISYIARTMGLQVDFRPHSPPHNDPTPLDNVAIWNVDGRRGFEGRRLDLIVTNASPVVVAWMVGDDGRAVAWRE